VLVETSPQSPISSYEVMTHSLPLIPSEFGSQNSIPPSPPNLANPTSFMAPNQIHTRSKGGHHAATGNDNGQRGPSDDDQEPFDVSAAFKQIFQRFADADRKLDDLVDTIGAMRKRQDSAATIKPESAVKITQVSAVVVQKESVVELKAVPVKTQDSAVKITKVSDVEFKTESVGVKQDFVVLKAVVQQDTVQFKVVVKEALVQLKAAVQKDVVKLQPLVKKEIVKLKKPARRLMRWCRLVRVRSGLRALFLVP
jgi:hypothetical protein